ncbi:MAG: DNA internalization-related competence protein ComEC/Rec2 [Pseudomonadota bacterium]
MEASGAGKSLCPEEPHPRRFSQPLRRPLPPLLLAFALGLAMGHGLPLGWWPFLAAAAVALGLALHARRGRPASLSPLILLFLVGVAATQASWPPRPPAVDIASQYLPETYTVEGCVLAAEEAAGGVHRLLVGVEGAEPEKTRERPCPLRYLRVWVKNDGPQKIPEPGEVIRFQASPQAIRGCANPGGQDVEGRCIREDVFHKASVRASRIEHLGRRESPGLYLAGLRLKIIRFFNERIGGPASGLCTALAVGARSGLPGEVQQAFAASGTTHLLAVSGMNLTLVGVLVFWLARRAIGRWEWLLLRLPAQHAAAVVAFGVVLPYALLVGWQAPAVRAAIMATAALVVLLAGRETDVLSALALAAFAILTLSPASLFEASFQLTFAALAGVILAGLWLKKGRLGTLPRPLAWLLGLLATSLAATLATGPLVAHHFNQLSLVGCLANVIMVPLIGTVLTPLCVAAALSLPLCPAASALILAVAAPLARLSLWLVSWLGNLPWAAVWVPTPDWVEVALLYGLLASAAFLPGKRRILTALLLLSAWPLYGWWAAIQANPPGLLTVRYLDVGRGNSALVVAPDGQSMLIDAAGVKDSDYDLGRWVVARALWALRLSRLDLVVCTHSHPDHALGLPFVLARFRPRELWLATPDPKLERCAAAVGCRVVRTFAGHGRNLGPARIEILWPPPQAGATPEGLTWDSENEHSTVLQLTLGKRSFLFPADIGKTSETALLASRRGEELQGDVLLAAHHASRDSNCPDFLTAVAPRAIVLSRGPGTHIWPSREVLQRFRDTGANLWRTDLQGMVTATTDGDRLWMTGWQGHQPNSGTHKPR